MHLQKAYAIREPADVGEARRAAVALGARAGMDAAEQGKVALVVTEAGTNLVKHGKGGEIVLGRFRAGARVGVEMLALDRGPGMADVAKCLQDGYSTAGSAGTGLGGISRLSSAFDIYSRPGLGTALLARVAAGRDERARPARMQLGTVCLPLAGESVSGDAWEYVEGAQHAVALVVDGLGHGPAAADAASRALRVFAEHHGEMPAQLMQRLHAALRSTRGAAVAIMELSWAERRLRFCSIGNIAAGVYTPSGSQGMVSLNGTAGVEIRRPSAFEYDWPARAHLVMHSDGLSSHWDLGQYPGILARDPSIIAGVLYRDHARKRDDVTVLVAREREAWP